MLGWRAWRAWGESYHSRPICFVGEVSREGAAGAGAEPSWFYTMQPLPYQHIGPYRIGEIATQWGKRPVYLFSYCRPVPSPSSSRSTIFLPLALFWYHHVCWLSRARERPGNRLLQYLIRFDRYKLFCISSRGPESATKHSCSTDVQRHAAAHKRASKVEQFLGHSSRHAMQFVCKYERAKYRTELPTYTTCLCLGGCTVSVASCRLLRYVNSFLPAQAAMIHRLG